MTGQFTLGRPKHIVPLPFHPPNPSHPMSRIVLDA